MVWESEKVIGLGGGWVGGACVRVGCFWLRVFRCVEAFGCAWVSGYVLAFRRVACGWVWV